MSHFLHLVGFFPFLLFIEKNRISLFYAKECDTSHKVLDPDSFIANLTLKNRKNHYDVKLLQGYIVFIYLVVLKQNKRNLRLSFLEIISYKANIILCWTLKDKLVWRITFHRCFCKNDILFPKEDHSLL